MRDRQILSAAAWLIQAGNVMEQLECCRSRGHAQQLKYVLQRMERIWLEVYGEEFTEEVKRLSEVVSRVENRTIH